VHKKHERRTIVGKKRQSKTTKDHEKFTPKGSTAAGTKTGRSVAEGGGGFAHCRKGAAPLL